LQRFRNIRGPRGWPGAQPEPSAMLHLTRPVIIFTAHLVHAAPLPHYAVATTLPTA